MDLDIDVSSPEAVYEQIVRQIQLGVQLGKLAPGMPLPSIRQFAGDLDLNPNTVAKAYKILENNRVIRTAGRKGTFISPDAASHVDSRNRQDAIYLTGQLVRGLLEKGLTAEQIKAAFASVIAATFSGEGK
ncbi:MAG TPA: GntR family transcriptional regulator [Janthinobacterium sp.]|jgi:GntR family transcriptional regulator|nr:GntR family transcriptional regulator [Janthinobacterium sp.]